MFEFDNFITNSLWRIFNDFQDGIVSRKNLCELKDFHYNNNIPDYNNTLLQQHYLLRYFPLYCKEYFYIYDHIISSNFIKGHKYSICSIGAGCGLDFYGLFWAIKSKNITPLSLFYKGIDKYNWAYKDLIKNSIPEILINDITSYSHIKNQYNVLIFPKSINEFSAQNFSHLKEIFINSDFEQKQIILISSAISSYINFNTARFAELCNIFCNKGYKCLDKLNQHFILQPGFYLKYLFPSDISKYLKNLSSHCMSISRQDCKFDCVGTINKYPVYNSNYIKYNFMRLQKS